MKKLFRRSNDTLFRWQSNAKRFGKDQDRNIGTACLVNIAMVFFPLICISAFLTDVSAKSPPPAPALSLEIDRERLEEIVDDSPLARSGDKPAWEYLFGILSRFSQTEIEKADVLKVGFMELDRQPVEYRGRVVRVSGNLLRCEFIPQTKEPGPFEPQETNDESKTRYGFYKSWVQVADQKKIPICVCSLQTPEGFPDDGRDLNEAVVVTGIFYKRQLFLSVDDEEITTPTILAKTFRWTPTAVKDPLLEKEKQTKQSRPYFTVSILTLLFFWVCLRFLTPLLFSRKHPTREKIRFGSSGLEGRQKSDLKISDLKINVQDKKQGKRSKKKPDDSDDDKDRNQTKDDFPTPSPGSDLTTIISKNLPILFAFLLSTFCVSASADSGTDFVAGSAKAVKIDAEFTMQQLFQMDELSWNVLGDERVSWDQQRDEILSALDRLRRFVPYSFLKAGISGTYAPLSDRIPEQNQGLSLAADPGQYLGRAFKLQGVVVEVEEISLNPVERNMLEVPMIYRCRILVPGQGYADVLTRFVPSAWLSDKDHKQEQFADKFATVYGIYIKRLPFLGNPVENPEDSETKTEAVDSDDSNDVPLAIRLATGALIPLLIAPKIEWYPASPDVPIWKGFLGSIGMDVGSFDLVPALRITDIKKKQFDDLPQTLQLLSRNEIIQRAFKFTEADRDPFYGLLHAAKSTSPGRIEQEARRELEKEGKTQSSAVRLFNNPAESRGKPILLTGTAKRILPTLVEDKEVRKLYGIDKYYQVYFFTQDSQSNPLIACVSSLPDKMPVGSDDKYSERITIAAIPYKLWIYESSAKLDNDDGAISGNKPAYAPLLVGRGLTWHPTKKHDKPLAGDLLPTGTATSISLGIFIVLFACWIVLRRFRSEQPIEFKLKK